MPRSSTAGVAVPALGLPPVGVGAGSEAVMAISWWSQGASLRWRRLGGTGEARWRASYAHPPGPALMLCQSCALTGAVGGRLSECQPVVVGILVAPEVMAVVAASSFAWMSEM